MFPIKSRVLLVDDNRDAVDLVSELLSFHHIENRVAYDGQSALEVLVEWSADIVFLDIQMPRMNGYQTAVAMHRLPGCAELPIVAWTSCDGDGPAEVVADARMVGRIGKPATIDALRAVIHKYEIRNRPTAAQRAQLYP